MSDITLEGFQKEYYMLTTDYERDHKRLYDLGILIAYSSELNKGFKVKKQLKTTKKGTKFNYIAIKTTEEFEEYELKLRDMLNDLDKDLIAMDIKTLTNELVNKECKNE